MAKIEFYDGTKPGMLTAVTDGAVPREGEFINIRNETWRVVRVTWAVDHADEVASMIRLRANVEMKRPT